MNSLTRKSGVVQAEMLRTWLRLLSMADGYEKEGCGAMAERVRGDVRRMMTDMLRVLS